MIRHHIVRSLRFSAALAAGLAAACGGGTATPTAPGTTSLTADAIGSAPVVIAENHAGAVGTSRNFLGQSITIPGASTFGGLTFSWDRSPNGAGPVAFGNLYVLDRPYLGVPSGLSTSLPGFVARSATTTATAYEFGPGVTLEGGKKYWFYADASGSWLSSFNADVYAGGDLYVAGDVSPTFPEIAFRQLPASWTYRADGTYLIPPPNTFVDANFRLSGTIR